jgi:hypothetical protein
MLKWLSEGSRLLAFAIVFAALFGVWMFRYEPCARIFHRNRITGAVCFYFEECWIPEAVTPLPADYLEQLRQMRGSPSTQPSQGNSEFDPLAACHPK